MDSILFCFLLDKNIYLSKVETEFKISIFEDETPFVTSRTFNLLTKPVSLFNQKSPEKQKPVRCGLTSSKK